MSLTIRNTVRVLILNEKDELLLMAVKNAPISSPDGKQYGQFWITVGGKIEVGESIQQAALREIYEETSIIKEEIELGPVVWLEEFDLFLNGILTHFKQKFIVARTKQNNVCLSQEATQEEKDFMAELHWFSLEKIEKSNEKIFPNLLSTYLPTIIAGNYPKKPLTLHR